MYRDNYVAALTALISFVSQLRIIGEWLRKRKEFKRTTSASLASYIAVQGRLVARGTGLATTTAGL
jgi:hypothetical protein